MPVHVGAGSSAVQISGGHSSDPTGASAGDLYYDTTIEAWKFYEHSSSSFKKISLGAPGESDNPAPDGKAIYDANDRVDGVKYIRTTSADPSSNNSSTYQTYCLLSDDTKWGGTGGWTLATHIPFSSSAWHLSGSFSSSNHYHSWSHWTRQAPHHYSGSGEFNYANPCMAIGYFIPFDDILIMTYDSSTTSFANPGATCTYSRNSGNSKESLYKIQTTRSDYVWSSGGRQSIYKAGNISNSLPTWNAQRSGQGFTGNPWANSGNTYGGGSGTGVNFNSFNLVFNTSAGGTYSSDATGNKTRVTTTMVDNNNSGNGYQHTLQHGFGSYHSHGGYEGTASYCLGQHSYCDGQRNHFANNDHKGGWSGDVFCSAQGSFDTQIQGWSIWVR